ncbi:MAG: hypothetical protein IPG74_11035 [Flavobacteriales bacterium]|nr:hypothetical protein [Flavobacteriales bacterium]
MRCTCGTGKWRSQNRRETAPFFEPEKIVLRQTSDSPIGHIDNRKRVNLNNVYNVGYVDSRYDLRYILGLLNSKLLNHIYQSIAQEKGRTFAEVKKVNLEKLPIATADRKSQARIAEGVISIVASNEQLQSVQAGLVSLLRSKYTLPTLSRALENWPGLEFKGFLAELKKAKVSLTLAEEAEWLTYFTAEKVKAQALQAQIAKTDKEIDALVYQLYGLTEEEVKVVEGKN